jgi:hypothetical protein
MPYLGEDGVDLRANLERIRKGEAEEWLREKRGRKVQMPSMWETFID